MATGQKSPNCLKEGFYPVADSLINLQSINSYCLKEVNMFNFICKTCGKEFEKPSYINNAKFCCFDCYTIHRKANRIPDEEYIIRFWRKVEIKTKPDCWIWSGWKNSGGYGCVSMRGKRTEVHRLSYELANGKIPIGLWVLHKCDNRSCVNPTHLFLGTLQDNMDDMVSKNRSGKGEKNTQAKLTKEQVLSIKREYINGLRCTKGQRWVKGNGNELAKKYGISIYHLRNIIYGQRWGWLSD